MFLSLVFGGSDFLHRSALDSPVRSAGATVCRPAAVHERKAHGQVKAAWTNLCQNFLGPFVLCLRSLTNYVLCHSIALSVCSKVSSRPSLRLPIVMQTGSSRQHFPSLKCGAIDSTVFDSGFDR